MTSAKLESDYATTMDWMQAFLASTATGGAAPPTGKPSIAPSPLTQSGVSADVQYRISDPVASDDESENDECYDPNATEIRGQEIPEWAHPGPLLAQLQRQQGVDPDLIFTNFEKTCDLMAMFEKKKRTFKVRGDSGWWAKDALTPAEEMRYKRAVGLA
jgi:hypothetical protein